MTTSNLILVGLLAGTLAGVTFLAACDRTVAETTKTTQGPGGTKTESDTVVQHPDGTVTETKDTHVVKP